jgi:hypothetical protein
MNSTISSRAFRLAIFAFSVASLLAVAFLIPKASTSNAASKPSKGANKRGDELSNYDIRDDKKAVTKLARYRSAAKKSAVDVADLREAMVSAEGQLRSRVPSAKVEYSHQLQAPEVISPDPEQGKAFLTSQGLGKRSDKLKNFLSENAELLGTRQANIKALEVISDYKNPGSSLGFVELKQEVNDVPVFQGEVKAGFTKGGEIIRVVSNFAPGLESEGVPTDFGDPVQALSVAVDDVDESQASKLTQDLSYKVEGERVIFGEGEDAPTAEKVYFPTEAGIAVPAWKVLIWTATDAFYVVVDSKDGTVLWRKNLTEHQTQPATYSVYAKPGAFLNIANNPFPFSPGPVSPNGLQGVPITRTQVTRIGNEAPYQFNQLGWMTDGTTKTDGNNVQAGLDRDGTDGIDLNSEAVSATRNFTFDYTPYDPNTGLGNEPLTPEFQKGSITQLFYIANWFHDEMYRMGFNEAARNFQGVNFTGQGLGNDRLRAEAQDSSDTNNATFTSPGDGGRGKMQMYLFTPTTPDIDGGLDGDVVVHELTHGVSNRLHGNSLGLTNDMSRGMGEGWSDFFAMSMLSHPSDPAGGIYTMGAYATSKFVTSPSISKNAYYGIRRFPTAIISSLGPNGKPHNPLTFADLDVTKFDLSDGAFAPQFNNTPDQVHNIGEVWSNTLWEVRARIISRLGWEVGNRRTMQFVLDGMKLSPLSPTFVDARDAIIAAGIAGGTPADVADMWAGFSARGLGASAIVENPGGNSTGGTGTARVTQSFSLPNLVQPDGIGISDASGDGDGYAEPGEVITLTVPISNFTGNLAASVAMQIVGGGNADLGAIGGIASTSGQASFTVPSNAPCGGLVQVTINVNSSLGTVSFVRNIFVGKPSSTIPIENFDSVGAPAIPSGWTASSLQGGVNFVTFSGIPDTPPNSIFAADPTAVGGGTDLTSPPVAVTAPGASLSFRHSFNTEPGWDGGALEISVSGGPFRDIVAAGGTFQQNGYNGNLGAGDNNPIGGRAAWTGNSSGYKTVVVQFPASAVGKTVQLRWRFGADDNTAPPGGGWNVDTVSIVGGAFITSFACSVPPPPSFANISGRVTTPLGGGLRNAVVSLSNGQGESIRANSSTLGYYQFENVPTGSSYTVTVASRRYRFTEQQVNLSNNLANLDFVGQE